VFTEPDDLPDSVLAGALQDLWGFAAASLEYQPVGFGSYHWLATDAAGRRLFATADDLAAKRRTAHETTDDAFDRLCHAFGTALALHGEAGLSFVVAPLLTVAGRVVARPFERYSLVAHPYVLGTAAGEDGEFANDADRQAVVDMLIQIHRARCTGFGGISPTSANTSACSSVRMKIQRIPESPGRTSSSSCDPPNDGHP
jgi:hypothetical protein